MNPALARDIADIFQVPVPDRTLKAEGPLVVAARTLAAAHEMTATTVVGVIGRDDVEALESLVADITEEYGLEATVMLRVGSYSVRFSRSPGDSV